MPIAEKLQPYIGKTFGVTEEGGHYTFVHGGNYPRTATLKEIEDPHVVMTFEARTEYFGNSGARGDPEKYESGTAEYPGGEEKIHLSKCRFILYESSAPKPPSKKKDHMITSGCVRPMFVFVVITLGIILLMYLIG